MSRFRADQLLRVREVRQIGLMIGVELKEMVQSFIHRLQDKGILAMAAGKIVTGIAEASTVQTKGVNQITLALEQIESVTLQNTADAKGAATAAGELSSQVNKLEHMISTFKIKSSNNITIVQ